MKNNIHICILGLGYVGLPVFINLKKKFKVYGFDKNYKRIEQLNKKIDQNNEFKNNDLILLNNSKFIKKIGEAKEANIFIICVPTPVNKNNKPDMSYVVKSCYDIKKVLKKGDIIVLESTVYPGTTEELCVPILEKSGLKNNKDFYIAYSPERINPGDKKHTIKKIKKILSIKTKNNQIIKKLNYVYTSLSKKIIFSSNIKETETAKLIENIQRYVNIALMNEIMQACIKMKIDFKEVHKLASTKWNFINIKPGLVGGHCLPVDPYYFSHQAKKFKYFSKLVLSGRKINNDMEKFIISEISKNIIKKKITKKPVKVLILGITYKENVSDIRNSLALKITEKLQKKYKLISVFDPHTDYKIKNKIKKFKIRDIKKYSLIVLLVKHKKFEKIVEESRKTTGTILLDIFDV